MTLFRKSDIDIQDDTTVFMALIAHVLSHVFHMINAASACALDNPDKRYLEDIRRASAAGQSLLRQITLLSRSCDSERNPFRKHRIRALKDAIQRTCRSTPADVRLLDDGFIIADMPILEDALHQMLVLARHGNAKPNVAAAGGRIFDPPFSRFIRSYGRRGLSFLTGSGLHLKSLSASRIVLS